MKKEVKKSKGEQIQELQREVGELREAMSYLMNMFQSFNSSVAATFRGVDALKVYTNGSFQALEKALCSSTGLSEEAYKTQFKEPALQEQVRIFEESYKRQMLAEGLNPETGEPLTDEELEALNEEAVKDMGLDTPQVEITEEVTA